MHLAIDAEIDVRVEDGRIVIEPMAAPKYDLDRLLAQITPENLHEEVSFGPAAGKAAV
jgi:antitoxin MazE